MTGLRELKKKQTRDRIAAAADRLFAERGYESVTVVEIAEAAQVAKVTLFEYFPSKEALALDGVATEDLAAVVARRPPGQSPLEALRDYHRATAASITEDLDADALVTRLRVIFDSPALSGAANALLYRQRTALGEELSKEYGHPTAALLAAQIAAATLTVQEGFFHLLAAGTPPEQAARTLQKHVELAFDLLAHGIESVERT